MNIITDQHSQDLHEDLKNDHQDLKKELANCEKTALNNAFSRILTCDLFEDHTTRDFNYKISDLKISAPYLVPTKDLGYKISAPTIPDLFQLFPRCLPYTSLWPCASATPQASLFAFQHDNKAEKSKLKDNLAKQKKANSELRLTNHNLNAALNEAKSRANKAEKELHKVKVALINAMNAYEGFFRNLFIINKSKFDILSDYQNPVFFTLDNFNLGMINSSLNKIQHDLGEVLDMIHSIDCTRLHNTRIANGIQSKSERSGSCQCTSAEMDDDVHIEQAPESEQTKEIKATFKDQFKRKYFAAKTPFALYCEPARTAYEELDKNQTLLGRLSEHREKFPLACKDSKSKVSKNELFDFLTADLYRLLRYSVPHIQIEAILRENENKYSTNTDSEFSDKVREIQEVDCVLIAATRTFKNYCPHCERVTTHKLLEPKRYKITSGGGIGCSVLTPEYYCKCKECKRKLAHKKPITLIDIPVDKILVKACVPYGYSDRLYNLAKESLNDLYQKLADAGNNEAAAMVSKMIDDLKSSERCEFNPESALNRLNASEHGKTSILYAEYRKRARDILKQSHTKLKISAIYLNPKDWHALDSLPVYKGCSANISVVSNWMSDRNKYISRSRFYKTTLEDSFEKTISRSRLTELDIAVARTHLHGVNLETLKMIYANAGTYHVDESGVFVTALKNRTSYLWGVMPANTSPVQMVYFAAEETRKGINFLKLIDYNDDDVKFDYALTDGYAAYFYILEGMGGKPRKHACCWAHFRRILHQCMLETGLDKIYQKMLYTKNGTAEDFIANLEKLSQEGNEKLEINKSSLLLLSMYYIINMIFANDARVIDAHMEHHTPEFLRELEEMRQEHSSHLVATLNTLIEIYIAANDNIRITTDGKNYCTNGVKSKANAFCLYWMNLRQFLIEFLNEPKVPLTNNDIERAFRLPAILKHISLSFKTKDGFNCFADQVTIIQNCNLCGVKIEQYIPWLNYQIQERVNELTREQIKKAIKDAEALWPNNKIELEKHRIPKKFKAVNMVKNAEGKETEDKEMLDLYDPRNPTTALYDSISYKGLTPFDFKKSLLAAQNK